MTGQDRITTIGIQFVDVCAAQCVGIAALEAVRRGSRSVRISQLLEDFLRAKGQRVRWYLEARVPFEAGGRGEEKDDYDADDDGRVSYGPAFPPDSDSGSFGWPVSAAGPAHPGIMRRDGRDASLAADHEVARRLAAG